MSERATRGAGKAFNQPARYVEAVRRLHDHGIRVLGCFAFGLDGDDASVFERTVELADRARIDIVRYAIVTPLPGTRLLADLEAQGRIVERDWERYDTEHVVFRPAGMTARQLHEGYRWAYRQTYRAGSIWRRLGRAELHAGDAGRQPGLPPHRLRAGAGAVRSDMDAEIRRARAFIWLVDYLLPLPLTAAMYLAWRARTGSPAFAAYTLLLGLAFGYVVPGIGTNLLGLWRFSGPLRVGNFFLHHGFMYAPWLSLTLYVTWGEWGAPGPARALTVLASAALAQGLVSSLHDVAGLKAGAIEIFTARAAAGRSPEAIVLEYGPIGFGLFGAAYALSCLLARGELLAGPGPGRFALLVGGGVLMMGLTGLPYVVKERRFIGAARRTPRRPPG